MPNERHYSNSTSRAWASTCPGPCRQSRACWARCCKGETLTDLVEIIRPEMFYTRQNAQIYSRCSASLPATRPSTSSPCWTPCISDGVFPTPTGESLPPDRPRRNGSPTSQRQGVCADRAGKYLVRQLMGVAKDILQDAGDEPDADLLLENAEQRI